VEQGFKKGASIAQNELKDTISMLNIIAMAFLIRKEELFEQIKPEIIKLCLALCHKLLQRELSNPEAFKELLMTVLEQIKWITKDIPIDVIVSSQDYEIIQSKFNSMNISQEDMPKIHLIADPFMEKGNCRLETSIGMMNFDIKRILQDLETKILEA
jgi:flagellar biosynthesis/type III secretory pathway protein FliH